MASFTINGTYNDIEQIGMIKEEVKRRFYNHSGLIPNHVVVTTTQATPQTSGFAPNLVAVTTTPVTPQITTVTSHFAHTVPHTGIESALTFVTSTPITLHNGTALVPNDDGTVIPHTSSSLTAQPTTSVAPATTSSSDEPLIIGLGTAGGVVAVALAAYAFKKTRRRPRNGEGALLL